MSPAPSPTWASTCPSPTPTSTARRRQRPPRPSTPTSTATTWLTTRPRARRRRGPHRHRDVYIDILDVDHRNDRGSSGVGQRQGQQWFEQRVERVVEQRRPRDFTQLSHRQITPPAPGATPVVSFSSGDAAGVPGVYGDGLRARRELVGRLGQLELQPVDLVLQPMLLGRSLLDPRPFPLLD